MGPIDKLIGKIYPVFGACLLIMAVGVTSAFIFGGYPIPEIVPANLINMHSKQKKLKQKTTLICKIFLNSFIK